MDLSPYKWKNRLLLVFASPASEEEYAEQLRLLEDLEPEFEERDLLLGKFPEHEAGKLGRTTVTSKESSSLRGRFNLDEEFATILVGKDGTEKYRTGEPVAAEEIFRRIDAMPIRRREMREQD